MSFFNLKIWELLLCIAVTLVTFFGIFWKLLWGVLLRKQIKLSDYISALDSITGLDWTSFQI